MVLKTFYPPPTPSHKGRGNFLFPIPLPPVERVYM